jgi:hypothetical protein
MIEQVAAKASGFSKLDSKIGGSGETHGFIARTRPRRFQPKNGVPVLMGQRQPNPSRTARKWIFKNLFPTGGPAYPARED